MGVRTISKTIDLSQLPKESKYITEINDTGITIHPKVYNGSSSIERSSYIQLDGTGMELFNSNGDSIAKYGEDIRLGNENEGKLLITVGGQGHTYEDAGTYIIDGSDNVLAQFLENGAQIGLNGKSHLEMDNNGMRLIDRDDTKYFEVSDLRDDDDFLVDRFVGDGQKFAFVLSSMAIEPSSADNTAVTIDGIPQTLGEGSSEHWYIVSTYSYYSMVEFPYDSPPADGAVIVVKYMSSENTTAFTFGTRKQEAPVGGLSSVFGDNCEARTANTFAQGKGTVAIFKNQAVFGRYNDPDEEGDYGLVIGNGTANNARSNALTVGWDGNVWCAGGITATPTAITLTYSQCTTGSYTRCYRIGNIVFLSFNINVTTSSSNYDYITGLPPALGGGWAGSSGMAAAGIIRWWVTTDGTLRSDGAPTAGWHNGNIVYICQ